MTAKTDAKAPSRPRTAPPPQPAETTIDTPTVPTVKPERAKATPRLSALDAAARVLAEAGEPLTTAALIEAMAAKAYWTSPNGATPAATLYAAVTREIATKGDASRFVKTGRGTFARRA